MRLIKYINESEKEFWRKIYKDDKTHWLDKNVSNLTKKVVSKYKEFNNVLEIGCAGGIDTFYLSKFTNNSIIGIDIIEDAIKEASKNLKNQPKDMQKKVSFEIGDAEKLRFKDKSFDFVYSLSVLHSTDINKSLKEVNRVLIPNGKSVIYVFINGKEGIDKTKFLEVCEKFFKITDKNIIKKKDESEDKHTALIVFLEKKEK